MDIYHPIMKKIANRRSIRLAVIVTILLVSFIAVKAIELHKKNVELQKKIEALDASLESVMAENEELKEKKDRGFSEEELFEIARQRLGLLFPNEILFIPEDP